jgi:mRNA interferase MazF
MTWRRSTKPPGWYPRRGEVCLFTLDKERPGLVISTNALNRFSLDVCIVPISSVQHKQFSVRPRLQAGEGGLVKDSWAKCDQVTTIEKRLTVYPPLGVVAPSSLSRIEEAIRIALELPEKR